MLKKSSVELRRHIWENVRTVAGVLNKALVACAVLLLAEGAAAAAQSGDREPVTPPAVQGIVDSARSLPAEYRADILLRLLEEHKIPGKKSQLALVDEVLSAASRVVYPVRRAYGGPIGDNRATRLIPAFGLGLDGMTIRLRVVKLLKATDPKRAWKVFAEIPAAWEPLDCADALAYDAGAYYDAFREFAELKPPVIPDIDKRLFLSQIAGGLSNVAQVAPVARLLLQLNLPASERLPLGATLAGRLQEIDATAWELLAAEKGLATSQAVRDLAESFRTEGGPSGLLVRQYGAFLTRQLSRKGCPIPDIRKSADFFNANLRALCGDCEALSPGPSFSRLDESDPATHPLPGTAQFDGLLKPLLKLRSQPALSKGENPWEDSTGKFIDLIEHWSPVVEDCPECVFHAKMSLYGIFIGFTPSGLLSRSLIDSYLTLLATDPVYYSSPIEWLSQLDLVMRLTGSLTEDDRKAVEELAKKKLTASFTPSDAGPYILARMIASTNPALNAYARLQEVAPKAVQLPPMPQ